MTGSTTRQPVHDSFIKDTQELTVQKMLSLGMNRVNLETTDCCWGTCRCISSFTFNNGIIRVPHSSLSPIGLYAFSRVTDEIKREKARDH